MPSFLIIAGMALMPLGIPEAHAEVVDPYATTTARLAIEAEFGTSSIMLHVAQCESEFRQFNARQEVLTGIVDHDDTGVFQINKRYHLADAEKKEIDFETLEGNVRYARYLYDLNGTWDWRASKPCWGKYVHK